jgi:serine protease
MTRNLARGRPAGELGAALWSNSKVRPGVWAGAGFMPARRGGLTLIRTRGLACAALAACLLLAVAADPARAQSGHSVLFSHHAIDPQLTDRIIVKWRTSGVAAVQIDSPALRAQRLSAANGIHVQSARNLYGAIDVVQLDHVLTHGPMMALLARLRADPGIEYAEPDGLRFIEAFPQTAPNDPHFVAGSDANGSWLGQWYLQSSSSTTPAALSVTTAWLSTLGSPSVSVAVIDTGIIDAHPDLEPNLLPGYDFVSCDQQNDPTTGTCSSTSPTYYFANDGHGWQPDAADPGDYIDASDITLPVFQNADCTTVTPSTWHGTKVAGVIGAVANNGIGIAGIAPQTMLLPIRAVGACTGHVSDIAAAIEWASGNAVTGVSQSVTELDGITHASIINLSLGAATPCSATEQSAVSDAINAGVLVVAAAGNEGGPVDAPASCTGVLSVAGLRYVGTKVGYSNLSSAPSTNGTTSTPGASVTIAAPAGDCVNLLTTEPCLYSIETTSDAGDTTPSPTPGFYTYALLDPAYLNAGGNPLNEGNVGTSFAAPMASGVAALMLASNPALTPTEVISRLQSSALPFPSTSPTSPTPPMCQLASTATDANGNYTDTSQDTECICTTATCGAGMLNAGAAVVAAEGIAVQITLSSTTGSPGQHITLNGSGSTASAGYTITSYQWTTTPSTSDQLINANQAVATLVVPSFRSITVNLTIVDSGGHTATGSATVQSAFGASAGVGSFGVELFGLAALAALRLWRRRRSPAATPN